MIKICLNCGKKFTKHLLGSKKYFINKRRFCSQKCAWIYKTGEKRPPFSKEWKENMSIAHKGMKIPYDWKGKKRKPFTQEHIENMRKNRADIRGSKNPFWRGGRNFDDDGYILIYKPNHPFAVKNYIREHRFVIEKYLRKNEPNHPALVEINGVKYLRPEWIVHHKGIKYPIGSIENKSDNRFKNLMLFKSNSEHTKFHHNS